MDAIAFHSGPICLVLNTRLQLAAQAAGAGGPASRNKKGSA